MAIYRFILAFCVVVLVAGLPAGPVLAARAGKQAQSDAAGPATLGPIADSYVADGANTAANFGSAATLQVQRGASGANREAYLRFNLSSFSGTVLSAKLRVFGAISAPGSVAVVAQLLRDNAFSEGAVTYDSRPEPLPIELARVQVNSTSEAWYEFDVSALVRQKKRSGSTIEFMLHSLVDTNVLVHFNAREAAGNRPQLVVETASALLVVGNATLGAGDAAVNTRLQGLGYSVTVKTGSSAGSADAAGKSLVLISSTVAAGDVNTKFRDVAVPVVVWDEAVYAQMNMTGAVPGSDFGTQANQKKAKIVDPAHALAAGREGTVTVAGWGALTWGLPGAGALTIASLANDASKPAIFAYEQGAAMIGQNAPARRVGLFLTDRTAVTLTHFGWTLFDAAVNWAAGARPFIVKKVFVLNYDPIIESQGNKRLSAHLGFGTAEQLVADMVTDMAQTTNDYVHLEVASFVTRDEWPLALDGTRYTDAAYLAAWNAQAFSDKVVDYADIMSTYQLDTNINQGLYDEVWISAPRGHWLPESQMVGPSAYYVNSGPILPPQTTASRNYMIESIEPTRPVALFEHGYIHRLEWLMRHVYDERYGWDTIIGQPSNWNTTPYDRPCSWASDPAPCATQRRHFWDDFTLVEGVAQNLRDHGDAAAVAGIGTAHFVPNATLQGDHNYDYGQFWMPALAPVTSNADDWLYNFPNLTGETRQVSTSEWAFESSGEKEQSGYMLWFNNHLPRAAGRHSDGVLYNWWEYLMNFNDHSEVSRASIISGNAGVAGATLSYDDGAAQTVQAGGDGEYVLTVPDHWSGSVTVSSPGYSFATDHIDYNDIMSDQTGQDYTPNEAVHHISGRVAAAGVMLGFTDDGPQTVFSDTGGNYSLLVPDGFTGQVTPALAGVTFVPANRSYASMPVTGDLAGQDYAATMTFSSQAAYDGHVLESKETSGAGGSINSAAATFQLGDDTANRQYRAILSFNTASLPNNAAISAAQLKIRQSGAAVGRSPFNMLGNLWADIRQGPFGATALVAGDFNAAASATRVAFFNKIPMGGWYSSNLNATGQGRINRAGITQLRLYFIKDDNNNHIADYMKFLSGNAATNKPALVITYTIP